MSHFIKLSAYYRHISIYIYIYILSDTVSSSLQLFFTAVTYIYIYVCAYIYRGGSCNFFHGGSTHSHQQRAVSVRRTRPLSAGTPPSRAASEETQADSCLLPLPECLSVCLSGSTPTEQEPVPAVWRTCVRARRRSSFSLCSFETFSFFVCLFF